MERNDFITVFHFDIGASIPDEDEFGFIFLFKININLKPIIPELTALDPRPHVLIPIQGFPLSILFGLGPILPTFPLILIDNFIIA
jgi:hypothetical protein